MMSEKTENRLATFVAILIAIFMAVGLNAQTDLLDPNDPYYDSFVGILQVARVPGPRPLGVRESAAEQVEIGVAGGVAVLSVFLSVAV